MVLYLKNNWRKILKYILIYIFVFICYEFLLFFLNTGDAINSFTFSHALRNGEIIYKDFNTVTTPLYAIIMSLGLYVYDNYITFLLEQVLLVTILIYFLEKILEKKTYLFLAIVIVLSCLKVFLPTYNFLILLFMVILYYLEKKHSDKDYLIGFIIGLAILSKHVIGCLLVIPTFIICYHDKRKIFRRLIGVSIPCFALVIYLLINNNLFAFIDLCFLGLFDFNNKNGNLHGVLFYLSILILMLIIAFIIKHKDLKYNYYLPCAFTFSYPLFDYLHIILFAFFFLLMIFDYLKLNQSKLLYYLGIILVFIFIFLFKIGFVNTDLCFYKNIKYYDKYYMTSSLYEEFNNYNKFLDKYCINKKCLVFSLYATIYDVSRDRKINYYDILLYGNLGYNGTNRIINDIRSRKNTYFMLGKNILDPEPGSQYNVEITNYIIKNYKRVDSNKNFIVYYSG